MAKSRQPFTHLPVGPWPRGMVNTVREDRTPVAGLMDAVNVNIRRDGTAYSQPEWESAFAGEMARDLFKHAGRVFCVLGSDLVELDSGGATPLMSDTGPVNWTVLNDLPVFCTRESVYQINDAVIEQVSGVVVDDQDLDDVLVPLPGGQWVDYWNGRLLVARGHSLLFSQPLRFGAHNPLTDYIRFPTKIEWMAPLERGIYVGLRGSVQFLGGETPAELRQIRVASESAPGMGMTVSSEFVDDQVATAPHVAVFFTSSGFTIGLPDGRVVYPQKTLLRDLPLFRGKLIQEGSRIFAIRGL